MFGLHCFHTKDSVWTPDRLCICWRVLRWGDQGCNMGVLRWCTIATLHVQVPEETFELNFVFSDNENAYENNTGKVSIHSC